MAISFESPAPAGFTDLAARYGRMAAQGAGQGNAANAAFQSNIAEAAMQQQTANQNRELQASTANADRTASLENAGRQRQFQLQQGEQENQQRQEQMKVQAQLAVEVQNAELSQTERIRLQRMKQSMGAIDSQDDLAPEEKSQLKLQLQSGIDILAHRDAHANLMAKQQQLADMHEQRAHALALKNMDDQQLAKAFDSKTVVQPHPLTGQPVKGQLDKDGVWKPLFDQHFYAPPAGKAEKPPTHNPADFDFAAHEKKAMAEAKAAYPAKDDEEKRNGYYQDILKREQARFDRGEMTIAGQKKGVDSATGSQPGQPAAQGQPQAQPQQQQPTAPRQPVNFDDVKSLSPAQKAIREDFYRDYAAIDKLPISEPKQAGLKGVMAESIAILADAGSVEALTPDEQAKLAVLRRQFLAGMAEARKAPPPAGSAGTSSGGLGRMKDEQRPASSFGK